MHPLLTVSSLRSKSIDQSERVYTLNDLRSYERAGTSLAVIGDPITHSLSPRMHKAALEVLASKEKHFFSWRYLKVCVPEESLVYALPLLHSRNFLGLNVTLPHKCKVLSLLSSISPRARAIGAVNMLIRRPMGYEGDNKDAEALLFAIQQLFQSQDLGRSPSSLFSKELSKEALTRPVVIWGAGGAARAAIYALLEAGFTELFVGNRSSFRLQSLEADFKDFCSNRVKWRSFLFHELPKDLPKNALFIQATPQGLSKEDPLPIPSYLLRPPAMLYDMVYSRNETPLVHAAREQGVIAMEGRWMLAHQGALSLANWTGRPVSTQWMLKALES